MRRVIVVGLLLIAIATFAALPRQTFNITMTQMPQGQRIEILAQSIQRDSSGTRATGNVRVRITHADGDRTVIHADEVTYHGPTGEIETHGDARITIEKVQ